MSDSDESSPFRILWLVTMVRRPVWLWLPPRSLVRTHPCSWRSWGLVDRTLSGFVVIQISGEPPCSVHVRRHIGSDRSETRRPIVEYTCMGRSWTGGNQAGRCRSQTSGTTSSALVLRWLFFNRHMRWDFSLVVEKTADCRLGHVNVLLQVSV